MRDPINLTPYDVKVHMSNSLWSNVVAWATGVGSALALALTLTGGFNPYIYRPALVISIVLGATTKIMTRVAQENEVILRDYRDIGDGARQDVLFRTMRRPIQDLEAHYQPAKTAQPVLPPAPDVNNLAEPIRWFDWNEISRNPVETPHVGFMGKSGGGKSTIAQWIASTIGGITIAADPHYEPGNYPTVDRVIGKGRRFGVAARQPTIDPRGKEVPGEYLIDIRDIIDGEDCNCCQLIMAAAAEMTRRYELMAEGRYNRNDPETPNINLILDEYNAYATLPGVSDEMWKLLQEARKVGIRVFLIVHAKEVKALGFEGKGSIRDNLTFVRLKKIALEHCKLQVNGAQNGSRMQQQWYEVLQKLQQIQRPAMVDEMPAEVPDLTSWLERNKKPG